MKLKRTMRVANRKMRELSKCLRRSISFDNGKEFAERQRFTRRAEADVYFTDP